MRSRGLEAIFKKNKTFRKNIFSKNIFESDKYAHKPENPSAPPHSYAESFYNIFEIIKKRI